MAMSNWHRAAILACSVTLAAMADSKAENELRRQLAAKQAELEAAKINEAKAKSVLAAALAKAAAATGAATITTKGLAAGQLEAAVTASANDTRAQVSVSNLHAVAEKAAVAAEGAQASSRSLIQPLWATFGLAAFATLTGMFGWLKMRELHNTQDGIRKSQDETRDLVLKIELSINSRMDALLAKTEQAALAQGVTNEQARQQQQQQQQQHDKVIEDV
jgi:hypothetical protein